MRKVLTLFLIAVAAIIGWLLWRQARPVAFVVSGFIEADEIRVGSRVGGRVSRVLVDEGHRVEKGQALLEIDPFDLREQLAESRGTLAAAQAEYDLLQAGYRKEEIEQARGRAAKAKAELDKLVAGPRRQEIEIAAQALKAARAAFELAKSEHERLSRLRENTGAATEIELVRVTQDLAAREAEVAAAEQQHSLLKEGTRKEDLAAAQAELDEALQALALLEAGSRAEDKAQSAARVKSAEAQVAAIEVRLSELTVKSPCDCTVEAVELQSGDLVGANAPTISLLDTSRLWVRTYVPEFRLGEVKLGQRVPIRVDSFPDERFSGEVTFIAREAEFTPRNIQTPEERSKQVFRIKVTLREGLDRLRVGMAADVMFNESAGS